VSRAKLQQQGAIARFHVQETQGYVAITDKGVVSIVDERGLGGGKYDQSGQKPNSIRESS
jgi:hypothetical protein